MGITGHILAASTAARSIQGLKPGLAVLVLLNAHYLTNPSPRISKCIFERNSIFLKPHSIKSLLRLNQYSSTCKKIILYFYNWTFNFYRPQPAFDISDQNCPKKQTT